MWESNDLEIVLVEEGPRTRLLTFSHTRYERMSILSLGGPREAGSFGRSWCSGRRQQVDDGARRSWSRSSGRKKGLNEEIGERRALRK